MIQEQRAINPLIGEWPKDWPSHIRRQDLAKFLDGDEKLALQIVFYGNLQADADGDYDLREFFQAAQNYSIYLRKMTAP